MAAARDRGAVVELLPLDVDDERDDERDELLTAAAVEEERHHSMLRRSHIEAPNGLVRLDTVKPRAVEWIWNLRIPRGRLTIADGDPGVGKSTIVLDLVARLSRGDTLPDDPRPREPQSTVLLAHEDALEETIVPRLVRADADLSRVHLLHDVCGALPRIPQHLDGLEQALVDTGATMLVLDPLSAYLSFGADAYRDDTVREALAPLAALADRRRVAVVALRHLRKSRDADALRSGLGSIALAAVARSVLMVGLDPKGRHGDRIVAVTKASLARPASSLGCTLVAEADDAPARVVWNAVTTTSTANELVAPGPDPRVVADASKVRRFIAQHPECTVSEAREATLDDGRRWKAAIDLLGDSVVRKKEGRSIFLNLRSDDR